MIDTTPEPASEEWVKRSDYERALSAERQKREEVRAHGVCTDVHALESWLDRLDSADIEAFLSSTPAESEGESEQNVTVAGPGWKPRPETPDYEVEFVQTDTPTPAAEEVPSDPLSSRIENAREAMNSLPLQSAKAAGEESAPQPTCSRCGRITRFGGDCTPSSDCPVREESEREDGPDWKSQHELYVERASENTKKLEERIKADGKLLRSIAEELAELSAGLFFIIPGQCPSVSWEGAAKMQGRSAAIMDRIRARLAETEDGS